MSRFIHLLKKRVEKLGFSVSDHQLDQFEIYRNELKDWNTQINLTSLTDDSDIIDKHFIDSLSLIHCEVLEHRIKIADVGTGAGFPGIPIKIYRQDIQLLLLESIGKKTRFLRHTIAKLGLDGVDVVNDRAEIIARSPEYRERYDLVVARCVAYLPTLVEYCLPLVSVGGNFVAYKGHEAEDEVKEAKAAVQKLGGQFERFERNASACSNRRILVFIRKVKETPDKYPRRPGIPQKRPL